MFEEFRSQVLELLRVALASRDAEIEPDLSMPNVERFGDLSTNVCFLLAPKLCKSPAAIAEELAQEIAPTGLVTQVKTEAGYLNFYLDYKIFAEKLLVRIDASFGRGEDRVEKVIVEHTSANPDGPIHIGHLRNAVIGDTLARILRFAGYNVEVHYYLNDLGKQAAKVVWGRRRFPLGEGKNDAATAKVYVEASRVIEEQGLDDEVQELLLSYERGDEATIREFREAVLYCLEGIRETLSRLDIHHDKIIWESTFVRDGSVERMIERLKKTGYAKVDNGALVLDLTEFGIEKEMVITRSDGTSLYITRDLAHHNWKMKVGSAINIWGADHKLVAAHLARALSLIGLTPPEFIIHEFISLPGGSMSTRKGVFVSADELLDETLKKTLHEVRKRRSERGVENESQIAEAVSVGAVRFNIARIAPEKSMVFKWEEALDFERQGAPFIQYAYARGWKILAKGKGKPIGWSDVDLNESEKRLIRTLSRFPDIVMDSASSRKVSIMASYAIELSNHFHGFYMASKVLGSAEERWRLALVKASLLVLESVMEILGVPRLEEM